mgnify:CR=1 FL=1
MKLSTRTRYGLRALIDIALHQKERPVSLGEISKRQGISKAYLEQIILVLRASGIIRSVRGKKGGLVLAKSPEQISLLEVIKTLEGPISLVECVEDPKVCPRKDECPTTLLWQRLKEVLEEELRSLSLMDLLTGAKRSKME